MDSPPRGVHQDRRGRQNIANTEVVEEVGPSVAARSMSPVVDVNACGICFLVYNEKSRVPKLLHCGHTYCLCCLRRLVVEKGTNHLPCPSCRAPTKIPRGGCRALNNNFQLIQVLTHLCMTEKNDSSDDRSQSLAAGALSDDFDSNIARLSSSQSTLPVSDGSPWEALDAFMDSAEELREDMLRRMNDNNDPEQVELLNERLTRLTGLIDTFSTLDEQFRDMQMLMRQIRNEHEEFIRDSPNEYARNVHFDFGFPPFPHARPFGSELGDWITHADDEELDRWMHHEVYGSENFSDAADSLAENIPYITEQLNGAVWHYKCTLCDVRVPRGGIREHTAGRRHQSLLLREQNQENQNNHRNHQQDADERRRWNNDRNNPVNNDRANGNATRNRGRGRGRGAHYRQPASPRNFNRPRFHDDLRYGRFFES